MRKDHMRVFHVVSRVALAALPAVMAACPQGSSPPPAQIECGAGTELISGVCIATPLVDDPRCVDMMTGFIEARPDLWNEDIGEV